MTGVVYLLYFLTTISAEAFVGRGRLVLFDAVNLIAYAFYIAVTLLFYYMFEPLNRSLSLLAALFSLVILELWGIALGHLWRWSVHHGFDDLQDKNFCTLGTKLRAYCLGSSFRVFGTIDRQQNPHEFRSFGGSASVRGGGWL